MPHSKRAPWWTLAGLVPCVMAVIGEAIPARVPPVQAIRPAAELRFEQFGVSYPAIPPQPVIEAVYNFQNCSPATVTIEDVEPSCGCLRWHLGGGKRTFAPGECGILVIRMHTANEKPGPHFYTLDVRSRGLRTHTEQLTFRVTLPEHKVSIEPSEVYFYQLSGEPDSRTIYVTDLRDRRPEAAFQVTRVESGSELVTADVLPAERDEQGRSRIPIELHVPGDVPPGRLTTYVRIATNDDEFTQLAFPVLIEGRSTVYGPPVDARAMVDIFQWVMPQPAGESESEAR